MGVLEATKSKPAAGGAAAVKMTDHAAYAAGLARLDKIEAERAEAEAEAERLLADLSRAKATPAVDPVRREALDLLGLGDKTAEELSAKAKRLEWLQHRIHVCRVAAEEAKGFLRGRNRAAANAVLEAAWPEYRRRLAVHAEAVVAAARSQVHVRGLLDAVGAEVAAASAGLPDHSFRLFGELADQYSPVGLLIKELVEVGALGGDESWLADVAFVARRPDGVVVDRVPPPAPEPARKDAPPKQSAQPAPQQRRRMPWG